MPKMKIVKRKLADGTERTYRYRVKPTPVGTLGMIIEEYKRSPAWNRLSPGSRRNKSLQQGCYDSNGLGKRFLGTGQKTRGFVMTTPGSSASTRTSA